MACLLAIAAALATAPAVSHAASPSSVIRDCQKRVVKIYGAGGLSGMEAYQTGFLISAEGHVLTAFSYVLDSDVITVTLDDGRKFEAQLLGADPRIEVAVLKIDAADLPCFDLRQAATAAEGSRVLAFSNLFGVATGEEPVSVLHGTVSAITSLDARRGVFKTPYQGPVLVLDAMTNNPGAAGGALTNLHGQLLGMLGKELRNARNNTWLNYAVPMNELVEAVEAIKAGQTRPADIKPAQQIPEHPLTLEALGLVLVPNVLERTPPFVDSVRADSPAAKAGLQPDDLIVLINDQLVQSCAALRSELARLDPEGEIHLVVIRGNEMREIAVQANDEQRNSNDNSSKFSGKYVLALRGLDARFSRKAATVNSQGRKPLVAGT